MREQASRNGYRMIVLIVLLGLSAGLDFGQAAQSNATANGAQATPTFRSSSRLVLVDVVVTDKAGQTVKGLKAADFTILEDGKTQPIRAFESHVWQKTPASMQKINLPPDQYTNFTEQQPNSAVNVVLLDEGGGPVRLWTFVDAFPVSWKGPTLSAASDEVATEVLEIAHHGLGPSL